MMKLVFIILFMVPLFSSWFMVLLIISILLIILFMMTVTLYSSMMSYSMGMDLVSYWMILLSVFVVYLMILASYKVLFYNNYPNEFIFVVLVSLFFLILLFSSLNLMVFYIMFESIIIPTLFLIFGWGYQPERFLSGLYLLIYTLFASFPMLISLFLLYDTSFTLFYPLIFMDFNFYFYISLIFAFLVKMPMFFVHFWLPKAHVEAPVSGSMILAGVLLKLGGYGLYRFMSFMYLSVYIYNYIWILISLFGSVIVGLLCLCQFDIKMLIAYSSVSHMGLVIGGIMTCNNYGLCGSLILMLGHGLCSSGLFALSNILYERSSSRSILINKGMMFYMPSISMFWFLLSINNMSSPPSLNLLGEILLFNSLLSWDVYLFLFLSLSSFLGCAYSIYLYSFTQHGEFFSGSGVGSCGSVREYFLMFFHWLPLNFLILKADLFTAWV